MLVLFRYHWKDLILLQNFSIMLPFLVKSDHVTHGMSMLVAASGLGSFKCQFVQRYAWYAICPLRKYINWNTLTFFYKLRLIKLLHSVLTGEKPAALSYLTNKPCTAYNFRRSNNIIVPCFTRSSFKSLLAIVALSFGTLFRLISQASSLIFSGK